MDEERSSREALAAALRLAERFGLNEGICNHFSLQLADGRFLLSPHGIYWSQIRASDILVIEYDKPDNAAEVTALQIHGAIHHQHKHATCVLHTHMPWATALTCVQNGQLQYVHQNSLRFYDDVAYDQTYNGLADTAQEGQRIASCMGDKRVLFLASHGVIVTGHTVAEAFDRLYYLERACEVQVKAMSTGQPLRTIDQRLARQTRAEFDAGASYATAHFDALTQLLDTEYCD